MPVGTRLPGTLSHKGKARQTVTSTDVPRWSHWSFKWSNPKLRSSRYCQML